jgi:transcriptional regulator with XRE-family HTH domain
MTDVLTLSMRVAEEIRVAMARKRMNQSELARHIGVSVPWVNDRLNGLTEIKLNDLPRIAAALGVSIISLIPEQERTAIAPYLPLTEEPISNLPRTHGNRPSGHPEGSRRPGDRRTVRVARAAPRTGD